MLVPDRPLASDPLQSDSLRIDRLLWHLRFAKSRSIAQLVIEQGHVRINLRRIERASQLVHVGDIITLMRADTAIAIRVNALPPARLAPAMARKCYELLD
jgi:ribosome-associated heat shock protein Hsp15